MRLKLIVDPGDHIEEVRREAERLAKLLGIRIQFRHNFDRYVYSPAGGCIKLNREFDPKSSKNKKKGTSR